MTHHGTISFFFSLDCSLLLFFFSSLFSFFFSFFIIFFFFFFIFLIIYLILILAYCILILLIILFIFYLLKFTKIVLRFRWWFSKQLLFISIHYLLILLFFSHGCHFSTSHHSFTLLLWIVFYVGSKFCGRVVSYLFS